MPAFDLRLFNMRQVSQNPYACLSFCHLLKVFVSFFTAIIEYDPLNIAVFTEIQHTAELRCYSQCSSPRRNDRYSRHTCDPGYMIGAVPVCIPQSVIISHCSLCDHRILIRKLAYLSDGLSLTHQKSIQITGRDFQDTFVKHRIYVIRAALTGTHIKTPVLQAP